jgi:triosephosphate isomerase
MHKTPAEARSFLGEFLPVLRERGVEVVVCPPFTSLEVTSSVLAAGGPEIPISTGAQDVHWEEGGAFTGEVSTTMLLAARCKYVIIGHSERRMLFGESDERVGLKVRAALASGLRPILCIGETIEERTKGLTEEVVARQLLAAVSPLRSSLAPGDIARLVIAYEPVWAIGSGIPARPEDAVQVSRQVRKLLDGAFGAGAGEAVRVQYGGSVKPSNIADFMESPDIDGALVGGASLDPLGFAELINNCLAKRGAQPAL